MAATHIYKNRWPIEQPPLASKQMIGAHRQFVSSEESSYRFPELTLLAGSILTYLAAIFPPIATGFWDRKPKQTPGRLRRYLENVHFSKLPKPKSRRIRRKLSITKHLPKGIQGHRRSKPPVPAWKRSSVAFPKNCYASYNSDLLPELFQLAETKVV